MISNRKITASKSYHKILCSPKQENASAWKCQHSVNLPFYQIINGDSRRSFVCTSVPPWPVKTSYYYSKREWVFLPSTTFDRQEVDALIVTRKILSQYQGTPYYQEVSRALDKVLQYLPGALLPSQLSEIYSFEPFTPTAIDPHFFALIEDAIRNKVKLNLTYRAFWNSQESERVVQPYRLHYSHTKENWTLFGYCELRNSSLILMRKIPLCYSVVMMITSSSMAGQP